MPDPVLDVLRRASFLIRSGTAWCQGIEALGPDGDERSGRDADACRWCGYGATAAANRYLRKVVGPTGGRARHVDVVADDYLDSASADLYWREVEDAEGNVTADLVNDLLGHAAILRVFDRAEDLRRADLAGAAA